MSGETGWEGGLVGAVGRHDQKGMSGGFSPSPQRLRPHFRYSLETVSGGKRLRKGALWH